MGILSALKNNNVDVENDLNLEKMQELFVKDKIDGAAIINLDDAFIANNYIKPFLCDKFDDIDAHRFGKRFRYWPAYSDNKTVDLFNGYTAKHWYVKPKFNDIKEEILNNLVCSITVNQWNRIVLYASKIVSKTSVFKKLRAVVPTNKKETGSTSNSSYNKYGVRNGDKIRLEHLVPLLIYINLDFVSKQLINSYNNNNAMGNDFKNDWMKCMRYHSQMSHLARLLRETVECYGTKYSADSPIFYHLADKEIVPCSLNVRFLSPTSVTTSLNAAFILNDFEPNEVVLELIGSSNSNLRYFNCSFLSDFPNEHEYLICGGLGCQTIANVYDFCAAQNYFYYIKGIEMLMNTMQNKKIQNYDDESIQKIAVALNALMQKRIAIVRGDKVKDEDDEKEENDDAYSHNMFAAMCESLQFAQINMAELLSSRLMKSALCNNQWNSIVFDVLSLLFPNICGYFIDFKDVKEENVKMDIVFNEWLIKMLSEINDNKKYECAKVKSIKFCGVDVFYDIWKEYEPQFNGIGWSLRTFKINESIVSIDYKL